MKERGKIYFTNDVAQAIDSVVDELRPSSVVVLTDANTSYFVLNRLADSRAVAAASKINIKAGEMNKNIESLIGIWRGLVNAKANRKSVIINIGGGLVSDMGGFAASTYNRGIRFINVPTTVLGAVDATIGGKTGINFMGLKNEIGAFQMPEAVIVSSLFFNTLNKEEILSGYGEMLKHALLNGSEMFDELLGFDIDNFDNDAMLRLIKESVAVKSDIVAQDPHEGGLRRALNFGHTIGHAFESLALKRKDPVAHGYAVAFGMIVELIISHFRLKLDTGVVCRVVDFVKRHYGVFAISCKDYDELLEFMRHDKKNSGNGINFTLLEAPGGIVIDNTVADDEIKQALDIYCDYML